MKLLQLSLNYNAIVDDNMHEFLSQFKWYANKVIASKKKNSFYPSRSMKLGCRWKIIFLHHVIAGHPMKGFHVDHINRNTLDNRRENLRVVSVQENLRNSSKSSRNKSGFKGVSLDKATGKYQVFICKNYKSKYLGEYETAIEAAKAYDMKAIELFGEGATTNKKLGLL